MIWSIWKRTDPFRSGAFGLFTAGIIGQGPEVLNVLNPVAVPQGEGLKLSHAWELFDWMNRSSQKYRVGDGLHRHWLSRLWKQIQHVLCGE